MDKITIPLISNLNPFEPSNLFFMKKNVQYQKMIL